ncbi:Hypothetical protein PHPALM_5983 [Phytophthora palmivora]|uniref:Uncharacterized protein n=1 Tax=Phytophthora palmivora TaxID=4796 RepID=A0A2P4YG17_9STRA|nr:Hypothetical protein PHPALM_5983 [Phytophthora palmivora]
MLGEEKDSLEFVEADILLDTSSKRLAATMDRFGFYLATNEGKKDGTFYLRLLRVKTSEEQGLTLIPDKSDFLNSEVPAPLDEGAPLQELLEAEPASLDVAVVPTERLWSHTQETPPSQVEARTGEVMRGKDSVQAYVNRMFKRVAEPAGATPDLTSHSFRRGGAQHANGDDRLVTQWIFKRGAWDMTKRNKAFAYITNTAREDRKVVRVLSGWAADDVPAIIDVATLDNASQERLGRLQSFLLNSCTGLKQQRLNVSTKVLSVLTAHLIRYYPQLKEPTPTPSIVTHVEECFRAADILVGDNKDKVLDADRRAEDGELSFLKSQNSNLKGAGSVLRALRPLNERGVLDERIAAHKRLLAIESITDPAPADTKDILNVVGHT